MKVTLGSVGSHGDLGDTLGHVGTLRVHMGMMQGWVLGFMQEKFKFTHHRV